VTLYVTSITTILSANVIVFLICRSTAYCKLHHFDVVGALALLSFADPTAGYAFLICLFVYAYVLDNYITTHYVCLLPCLLNVKKASRQPTICCWLCDNLAHPKCADVGHSAGIIADRTESNTDLDFTCPSWHHIKVNIMAFIRQTVLEHQSLSAGVKDLSARFQKADSTLKGRILVSDILNETTSRGCQFYFVCCCCRLRS